MTLKPDSCAGALRSTADRLGPIEYRSPAALTAYENNPRKHPEQQLIKLWPRSGSSGSPCPSWSTPQA